LSFGSSSGGRGSYERKNVKRKKQSFHTHKVRVSTEEQPQDFAALKSKVIVSLAHLGEQKFSAEPGGYAFENWMKSFNLLLDDFEDRAGPQSLPREYYMKRQELTASLFKRTPDSADLDKQLSNLADEERKLNRAIALSSARNRAEREKSEKEQKIQELEEQAKKNKTELEELKRRLALRKKDVQESRGLFRRFVSGLSRPPDATPVEVLETNERELVSQIQSSEHKISELRAKITEAEMHLSGEDVQILSEEEMRTKLAETAEKIEEIEARKMESAQLSEERKEVTRALSETISKLVPTEPNSEPSAL
jgi:DNA repair exonuclease SbcCD ATPase subunit